ncbi:MAG TPA: hypothetical protein VFH99_02670 [Candidatus Saccharimonadales bacterium]|nr:hypothetical protein [Candidatus Saccharimonadales bacterium]
MTLEPVSDELLAQAEAGEITVREAIEQSFTGGEKTTDQLRALRESVGMGDDAQRAFWEGMEAHRAAIPLHLQVPEGEATGSVVAAAERQADAAAFLALVVGLTARQLADENQG